MVKIPIKSGEDTTLMKLVNSLKKEMKSGREKSKTLVLKYHTHTNASLSK